MAKKNSLVTFKGLVASVRIDHLAYTDILQRLTEAYEDVATPGTQTAVPVCLHLVGETRTGKSCVVNDFLAQYLPIRSRDGLRRTVLYAAAPPKATVKAILEQFLKALGDPYWTRGTESNMTQRLLTLLEGVGCRMIILDEFQHLCDKGQKKLLALSADWLKTLINTNRWAFVAVGLPESASVINANCQLAGRFDPTMTMPLFDWRVDTSRKQFKGVLKAFCKELAPFELPDLGCDGTALRIYLASSGRLGLVAKLLERAVNNAIRAGTHQIRMEDLAIAFETAIWFAPRFPLAGGPFRADIALCGQESVVRSIAAIAAEERYEDNSGTASLLGSGQSSTTQKDPEAMGQKHRRGPKRRLRDRVARAI